MHKILAAAVATVALSFGALTCTGQPAAAATTVAISCGSVGIEFDVCRQGAEAWAQKTGNAVRLISTPNDTNERLALYQQLLSAKSGDIDVFQIDVIWPGILASHFVDLTPKIDAAVLNEHFKPIVENDTVKGQLIAMPWFTDAGLLYYRKDLLEKYGSKVPETWQDMTETAKLIQDGERKAGNDRMTGYVFQGRAYEGLTCNALEWLDSFRAGTIVDENGKVTVNNPKAEAALTLAKSWVNDISPQGVLNYSEEESRGVFQSGNAVFMRNWPYAWPLANAGDSPVKGKIGVASLPKGGADGKHTGALGGWQLAVSKYSKNQDAAIDLVKYLTSKEEQKRRALVGSYNPTIVALYDDPEIIEKNPFFKELKETFLNAVARPSKITGTKYNQVSSEFWNTIHATLSGNGEPKANLASLEKTLDRIGRGGKW